MSSTELKKSIGKTIIGLNDDILEFLKENKSVKEGEDLSKKGEMLKKAIGEKKKVLAETLEKLEDQPDYVTKEKLDKTVKMIKNNIETAAKVIENNGGVIQNEIVDARENAVKSVSEVDNSEVEMHINIESLTKNLNQLDFKQTSEGRSCDDDELNAELINIGSYQAERFKKMKSNIVNKMNGHREELLQKWNKEKRQHGPSKLEGISNGF